MKIHNKNYNNVHSWIRSHYSKASKCENKDCSIKNPKRYEWALIRGKRYVKNIKNFKQLCVSCHRNYDMTEEARLNMSKHSYFRNKKYCTKGHKYSKDNTYLIEKVSKTGRKYNQRSCKICLRQKSSEFKRQKLEKKKKRLCLLCGKVEIPHGRYKYCGSYKLKTGCSYIKNLEIRRLSNYKWRKNNLDWNLTSPLIRRMKTMDKFINKVIQGDCLEVMKGIPDKSVDMILTDPPYGMEFKSNYRKIKYEKIENDNNLNWLPDFVSQGYRILKDNTHAYFFCSFHNVDIFKQEIQKHFEVKNILVWVKNNTGMGDLEGDYAPQYEFCIYARKGNRKLNEGRHSNILQYNRTGNVNHPTEKPQDLFAFLIRKSSSENEIVFDGFLGGGTTAIACKLLNRNYIGCEISKEYCEIAEQRIKNISNTLF